MAERQTLGDLEELVLLAVLRLGNGAYGASVRRELSRRADRAVSVGTVYVTLTRLEAKGLARSRTAEGGSARGGRPRRLFELTPEGLDALRAAEAARAGLREGLGRALGEPGA